MADNELAYSANLSFFNNSLGISRSLLKKNSHLLAEIFSIKSRNQSGYYPSDRISRGDGKAQ